MIHRILRAGALFCAWNAGGHLREAELMSVNADGVVLLVRICPAIWVTFLAGHPDTVELQID